MSLVHTRGRHASCPRQWALRSCVDAAFMDAMLDACSVNEAGGDFVN